MRYADVGMVANDQAIPTARRGRRRRFRWPTDQSAGRRASRADRDQSDDGHDGDGGTVPLQAPHHGEEARGVGLDDPRGPRDDGAADRLPAPAPAERAAVPDSVEQQGHVPRDAR